MSVYIPTVLEFQDGLLFLEVEPAEARLVWTNGYDIAFPFEPIFLQIVRPDFSTYPDLKVIALESMTSFRRSSAIAISDFVFWLQNVTDTSFDDPQLLIDRYLEDREINTQPLDYPIWLKKLRQQIENAPVIAKVVFDELQKLKFSRESKISI